MARPEQFGAVADGVTNCAPAINQCLSQFGAVELGEGVYVLGDSGQTNPMGTLRSCIMFGWGEGNRDGIRITGAGRGRTILKFADDTSAKRDSPVATSAFMIRSISPVYHGHEVRNTRISGITLDGNYDGRNQDATISGIDVTGPGMVIEDCEFLRFGVGPMNGESFVVFCTLAADSADGSQGTVVRRCSFHTPGRNARQPVGGGSVEAVTYVCVGGALEAGIFASGCAVMDCTFKGKSSETQTSPLHGVTPVYTTGFQMTGNRFGDFEGTCFYVDTGIHRGTRITGNTVTNGNNFVHLTSQNMFRFRPSYPREFNARSIAIHDDVLVQDNSVQLGAPITMFWLANREVWPSMFATYIWDRDFGPDYREDASGFDRVMVVPGAATGFTPDRALVNVGGFWPASGSFRNGVPWGPVPDAMGIHLVLPQAAPVVVSSMVESTGTPVTIAETSGGTKLSPLLIVGLLLLL